MIFLRHLVMFLYKAEFGKIVPPPAQDKSRTVLQLIFFSLLTEWPD